MQKVEQKQTESGKTDVGIVTVETILLLDPEAMEDLTTQNGELSLKTYPLVLDGRT